MIVEVIVGIFLSIVSGILAYLSPAIKMWLYQKTKEDQQFRLDVITFVTSAKQVYTDNEELIARVQYLISQQYPGLNTDYVLANIQAVMEWLEKGTIEIYTGASK